MAETNEVQAIDTISAAVGQSEVQIILANQCIKAQAFLVSSLKRQFNLQKETAKCISTDNLRLQAEINNAEQEIKSLTFAHESIRAANVELKKDWLLAKEMAQETAERIQTGEKKYDDLWEECKSRYESIYFVQNWLEATKRKAELEDNINILDKEIQGLLEEIKSKENIISQLDKKRIIELAEYMVRDKPKYEEDITTLSKELKVLNGQVEQLIKNQVAHKTHKKETANSLDAKLGAQSQNLGSLKIAKGWPNLNQSTNSNFNSLMPKLQLMNTDVEVIRAKLDQIKRKAFISASPVKEVSTDHRTLESGKKLTITPVKAHEYVPLYFWKSTDFPNYSDKTEEANTHNYAKRKLINILEDIKLDKNDTYNLVSKVNVEDMQEVSVITPNRNQNNDIRSEKPNEKDQNEAQNEEIEELDLTSNAEEIILPPSGFMDQLRSSQDKKKKVCFELPSSVQEPLSLDPKEGDTDLGHANEENEAEVTINSEVNKSADSEESFTKIKDMILKKHNLDLSPPFVYGKNTVNILKRDEVVKSNYFKLSCEELPSTSGAQSATGELANEAIDNEMVCDGQLQTNATENEVEVNDGQDIVSSAKDIQEPISKPVTGFLFNHGPSGLPESLDMSVSTMDFEDGDADYPQFSSLLLSPKADLPMASDNEKPEPISQDIPNFLSGLRKTGLSFFGKPAATGSNMDASASTGSNNFMFAFGSDDKKKRGGLFNMFN